jgi:serine/threonine-protein kinase HipA
MNINVKRLIVKYNDNIVGYLEELPNKKIGFQYDLDWIKNGFSVSPFHLPLTNQVVVSKSEYFEGLFGVFYDSLPDGWGTLLFRRMLQRKGINYDKVSILSKLSLLSSNGLGGLTYEPSQNENDTKSQYDFDELSKEINQVYEKHKDTENFDLIYKLGGASGGARPKAHVNIDGDAWIVKFPSSIDPRDIGFLEYKANDLALKSGINVNEFKLFPSNDHKGYFGAKRFDRIDGKRVHMISLSSVLETTHQIPNLDYSHLFQVIQRICIDQEDIYEAYRRMVFNVLYENKDDHGKNFAFIYDENLKGYRLSPFYDITNTPMKMEHEMTVLGKGKPDEEDLLEIAKKFNLSVKNCEKIIEVVKQNIHRN